MKNGTEIPLNDSIKYWVIILDKRLTFKNHIQETCDKGIRCGRALTWYI